MTYIVLSVAIILPLVYIIMLQVLGLSSITEDILTELRKIEDTMEKLDGSGTNYTSKQ